MKFGIRMSMLGALAVAMIGCGGAKLGGGKQGAAAALHETGQAGNGARGALLRAFGSYADINVGQTVEVKGDKGGTATVKIEASGADTTDSSKFLMTVDVTFNNYSEDGKNTYNGNMKITMKFSFNVSGTGSTTQVDGEMALTYKGKITLSGEISDFVEADVTETATFSSLQAESGSITVTLNGSIATSTEKHTYTNEKVTFTAGQLEAASEG